MFNITSNNEIGRLYESFYKIRKVEQEIIQVYPTGRIRTPIHLSMGQESASVGVCAALKSDDIIFCSYRCHAAYLAKGGNLNKMIAELYGKETGCAKGVGGAMHLIDTENGIMGASSIVGTTIANAVGYAYALKLKGKPSIVVCFFGEGATDEGSYAESLNFAVLKKLPVLFICENNGYAADTPTRDLYSVKNLVDKAKAAGIEAYQIGNYTDIIYKYSKSIISNMREDRRPRLIECRTYRWRGHVGVDYEKGLDSERKYEIDEHIRADELLLLSEKLPQDMRGKIRYRIDKEVIKAFRFADDSDFPESDTPKAVFKE